jgi:DNA-binding transcriptional ArsR family regulator
MDDIFKALADPGRRALLDALRADDAQTLTELCEVLPDMTRFGVMKHLRLLEEAHLVVTEKVGRTKLHHLNPVPIREIHDRWISNYAAPYVAGLIALRNVSEAAQQAGSQQSGTHEPSIEGA